MLTCPQRRPAPEGVGSIAWRTFGRDIVHAIETGHRRATKSVRFAPFGVGAVTAQRVANFNSSEAVDSSDSSSSSTPWTHVLT